MPSVDHVLGVLGAADAVAHVAFFWIFVWRVIDAGMLGRMSAIAFAVLAGLGFVTALVGRILLRYGRRTPLRRFGVWAIAGSTALAGALLVFAA